MAENYHLEVVTPRGTVFEGDVVHVRAPGSKGSFGVLAGHTPFITPMATGVIEIDQADGEMKVFATSGGLADVHGEEFLILAETAEERQQIDLVRAREAKERAEERLAKHDENLDVARARAALMRALNRITIAQR